MVKSDFSEKNPFAPFLGKKGQKRAQNEVFGICMKIESLLLAGITLKWKILWSSVFLHTPHDWGNAGSRSRGQKFSDGSPQTPDYDPKRTFWTPDPIWVIWFVRKWSKTLPIMLKNSEIGPKRARKVPPYMAKNSKNHLFLTIDRIWIIWFGWKWSKTIPILVL